MAVIDRQNSSQVLSHIICTTGKRFITYNIDSICGLQTAVETQGLPFFAEFSTTLQHLPVPILFGRCVILTRGVSRDDCCIFRSYGFGIVIVLGVFFVTVLLSVSHYITLNHCCRCHNS